MSDEKPLSESSDEERLDRNIQLAEDAYTEMYDSLNPTARYSNAKEYYYDAISIARKLGRDAQATDLEKRLAHIKAVFRAQFS